MLKLSGCVAVAVAAASIAFAPAAEACQQISNSALDLITDGAPTGHGAPFFTAAVKAAFEYNSIQIATLWNSASPSSPLYYDHILNEQYFTHITAFEDADADGLADNIEPGDILSIDATTTYNGHTMVILDAPHVLQATLNPVIANTTQWVVEVADSTTTGHGCSSVYPDSRGCGAGFVAGLGTGFMRLYTDNATGDLLGYTWSVTNSATAYYAPSVRPYAIGRLTPCPPL